jgi:hypothetical protein
MIKPTNHWNDAPLLRAGANVISMPVKTTSEASCTSFMPRYNVGNIHEIKQFWNETAEL